MNRRTLFQSFAIGAAGLLVPEPVRAYSFAGGWAVHWLDDVRNGDPIRFGDVYSVRCTGAVMLSARYPLSFRALQPSGGVDEQLSEALDRRFRGRELDELSAQEMCRFVRANS